MPNPGHGGWSERDGRTAQQPGAPDWRITVPLPRRSDDPPRPHAPLRSLDPGWRSGRTPVTQYGDKLVFASPHDGGAGGETWDEFWRDRPDEDDPEARISLQWLVRVALIVGVVMLVAGLTWAGIQSRQRQADPGTGQAPAGTGQGPSDPGATHATSPDAGEPHPGASQATDPDATQPRPDASQATGPGAAQAWASPAPAITDGDGRSPALGQQAPVAAISPASVRLGERRTGTFKLTCTGDCRVTSFSGSNGIDVSGNGFTVRAPAARPGCAGPPVTESGVITVHWTGTAADGETAGGTLTMMVSWTVASDRGALIPYRNGGGYWSNCPRSRE